MQVDAHTMHVTDGMKARLVAVGLLVTVLATGSSGQTSGSAGQAVDAARRGGAGLLHKFQSGLSSFPALHTARVTVAELGNPDAESRIVIVLRDREDRVVAHTAGVLRRAQPVQLDFPVADKLQQLRITVRITGFAGRSRPSTTVEDLDVDGFTVVPKPPCGPPSGPSDAQFNCPGWEVTSFVQ